MSSTWPTFPVLPHALLGQPAFPGKYAAISDDPSDYPGDDPSDDPG